MITIRAQQLATFDALFHDRFVDRLVELLRTEFAAVLEDYPEPKWKPMIRQAMESGSEFKIVLETDVFHWVLIAFLLGPDFLRQAEHSWVRELVADESMAPGTRLLQIRTRLEKEADGTVEDAGTS